MKNENMQFFCPTCGPLEKDKNGEPIHPTLDYWLAQQLNNGSKTLYIS